jgi:Transposase DDE domain group 1
MQDTRWDHALKVTGGGTGLAGHAGTILLRKAAGQAGLTAALSAALRKAGTSPLLDRGIVLVSMAAAIALGATSMSDIAVLAHLAPVLGGAPSGPTIRRALDLAGTPAVLDRVGLRNLPSKSWQVNTGWVLAANIAADLAAWTRLLGFRDDEELRDADPGTLRRIWHIPARLARHARERVLKISPDWPWKDPFLTCWQRLRALPAPA